MVRIWTACERSCRLAGGKVAELSDGKKEGSKESKDERGENTQGSERAFLESRAGMGAAT